MTHSRGRGRRRVTFVAVGILVTVVVAEALTRVATARSPAPLVWSNYEAQNKAAAMEAIRARDATAPVVFVGSSTMNAAADTRPFDRALGGVGTTFNAALQGMDLRAMEFWIDEVIVPRLRPRVLIAGVTSREINDNGKVQKRLYNSLLDSRAAKQITGRERALERVDRWLSGRLDLVAYRTYLRRPTYVLEGDPDAARGEIDDQGNLRSMRKRQGIPYYVPPQVSATAAEDTYNDYEAGGVQVEALDRIASKAARRGIELIVVRLPVTDDIVDLHPNGRADFAKFERVLADWVEGHDDVTFVDAHALIEERSAFADPNHLSTDGMQRFADELAPVVVRTLQ